MRPKRKLAREPQFVRTRFIKIPFFTKLINNLKKVVPRRSESSELMYRLILLLLFMYFKQKSETKDIIFNQQFYLKVLHAVSMTINEPGKIGRLLAVRHITLSKPYHDLSRLSCEIQHQQD